MASESPFDLLGSDVLGVLLSHLDGAALESLAGVCASLRRRVMGAEALWAAHLGGRALFDEIADRAPALAGMRPGSAVSRVLAARKAALANWRSAAPRAAEALLEPEGGGAGVVISALELDGLTLAAGGSDHCVRVWALRGRRQLATLRGHTGAVRCLLLRGLPDGCLLSGAWDRSVRRWDLRTGACARVYAGGHERCVMALALASEHVLVSAGGEGRVVWWDLRSGARVRTRAHGSPVLALEVSARATRAAFADGSLRVWPTQLAPAEAALGLAECLVAPLHVLSSALAPSSSPSPPAPPAPRLPGGQRPPAEMLALHAESSAQGKYVCAAFAHSGGGCGPTLALCSHRELVLGEAGALLDAPAASGPEERRPPGALRVAGRLDCAGIASCCALLPEASVALVGCRSTIARAGACVLLQHMHRRGPPARLPVGSSPAAILARWDVLLVGTQRGQVHIFDMATCGQPPPALGSGSGPWRSAVGALRARGQALLAAAAVSAIVALVAVLVALQQAAAAQRARAAAGASGAEFAPLPDDGGRFWAITS